jgi:flavodoxin
VAVKIERRSFLRLTAAGVVGATADFPLSASGAEPSRDASSPSRDGARPEQRILLAYFSRAGWNGGRRNLKVGNTEVLARMISNLISCDVHRIKPVAPYPHDYEATVRRNVREQDADARPRIANCLKSIDDYDVVLLGSPIWNVRPPMIMSTFAESFDFSRKTIHPFVTYAVSGLGDTMETYADLSTGGRITTGLAVRGETASQAKPQVHAWLRRINLLR